jgi:phage shock protein A
LDKIEYNSLTKEIESWKNDFAFALRAGDRKLFMEMIEDNNKYTDAINAKGEPFTTESLFIALILEQQKMIKDLITKLSKGTN